MGFVYSVKGKDRTDRWYVCFKFDGKRIAYVVSKYKKDAQTVLRRIDTEIAGGVHNPERFRAELRGESLTDANKTLGWLVGKFLAEYKSRKGTPYYRYRAPIWLGHFGKDLPLSELTSRRMMVFRDARREVNSDSTVVKDLIAMGTMFKWAEGMGYWSGNPANTTSVRRPRLSRETTNRHLTEDEYERLVDNSPRWLARVIRWACATGLDRGVVIGLRWADLELKRVNGRIISGTIRMVRPKTGKLIKQTLNERALEALRQASGVRHKDGIIFLSQNGQHIDNRYINRALDAALERSGISGVSFRSFRHTFATRCVKKGIHATIIGEMIGDSSASVLERYMHTDEEMHNEAARLLSEC